MMACVPGYYGQITLFNFTGLEPQSDTSGPVSLINGLNNRKYTTEATLAVFGENRDRKWSDLTGRLALVPAADRVLLLFHSTVAKTPVARTPAVTVAAISRGTHVAVGAHGWTRSEIIGAVHRMAGVVADRRGEGRRRMPRLIKQRLLTWK